MADTKKVGTIFDKDEFRPWRDLWEARLRALRTRGSYYDGSAYSKLRESLQFLGPRLTKSVKPLYLPLHRAVHVDAGIIPGSGAAEEGSIVRVPWPLREDMPGEAFEAKDVVFEWSSWDTEGVLLVHYGAKFGESALKVGHEGNLVFIDPVDPAKLLLSRDPDGGRIAFYVEKRSDASGQYEYAEVTTPDVVRTFRDGEPRGFDGLEEEFPNMVDGLPYVPVRHIEAGGWLGESTYEAVVPMLDEVNELGSYLATIISRHAEAQWAVIGAEPGDLEKSGENIWYIPGGGDVKAVVATIDVKGTLEFIREIAQNVREGLPELSLAELRSKTQIATATLELQLMELILKVQRIRPNYDRALSEALRLAGVLAGEVGAAQAAALADGVKIDADRPVLPLDRKTEIELQMMELELGTLQDGEIREGEAGEDGGAE